MLNVNDFLKEYYGNRVDEDKNCVYYSAGEIWVSYSQGSGQTIQLPDTRKYLNNDNKDIEHFDSTVNKIEKWSKTAKVLKSKVKSKLFEIPVYPLSNTGDKYEIWGGNIKSIKKMYMIVTVEKSTIINFFEKKNEALNWMKHLS